MPLVLHDCTDMSTGDLQNKVKAIGKPVLLKFSLERCPPCDALKRELSGYKTDLDLHVLELHKKLDKTRKDDDLMGLVAKYDITGFPTVVIVDGDMRQIDRMNGFSNISKFNELVDRHRELFGVVANEE